MQRMAGKWPKADLVSGNLYAFDVVQHRIVRAEGPVVYLAQSNGLGHRIQ